jgi:deoxyribonuclease-4
MDQTEHPIRFGTVGAPQTTPGSGTPAAIEHIRQLGLDHLEIAWVRSVRISDAACDAIRAAAEQHGVSLSIHAPYYINLNSQTPELLAGSTERLLTAARKGYRAGARDIIFHPGSYHGQPPDEVYSRARDRLRAISETLDAEGIQVTLRPETMGKSAMFGSLDEVLRLSQDVPGVAPCIDWAHLHARSGDGSFNSYAEFAAALTAVRDTLGTDALRHLHSHLSGIGYTAKGEKEHLPLNEADLRYRELLQAWVDFGVGGTCAVEAPQPFHTADALTIQATFRRLSE